MMLSSLLRENYLFRLKTYQRGIYFFRFTMRFIEIGCEFYPNTFGNEPKEIMKLFFSLELLLWETIRTGFLVFSRPCISGIRPACL